MEMWMRYVMMLVKLKLKIWSLLFSCMSARKRNSSLQSSSSSSCPLACSSPQSTKSVSHPRSRHQWFLRPLLPPRRSEIHPCTPPTAPLPAQGKKIPLGSIVVVVVVVVVEVSEVVSVVGVVVVVGGAACSRSSSISSSISSSSVMYW